MAKKNYDDLVKQIATNIRSIRLLWKKIQKNLDKIKLR